MKNGNLATKASHPLASHLEILLRRRLLEQKEQMGLSDEALGIRAFRPLGYQDVQKKVNNLLTGRTSLSVADFYIMCEALSLPADRVFTSALDDALRETGVPGRTPAVSENLPRRPGKEDTSDIRPVQSDRTGARYNS